MDAEDRFLASPMPIGPEASGIAAAAIIMAPGGYLLQLRDASPDIWFPAHWGLFGGAVERGENPREAVARELHEELQLEIAPRRLVYFTQISFDFRRWSRGVELRYNFELSLIPDELVRAVLREGQEMRVFSREAMLALPNVTPYDSHALRLHATLAHDAGASPWPRGAGA